MRHYLLSATAIATGVTLASLVFSGSAFAGKFGNQMMVKPSVSFASRINPRRAVRVPVKVRVNDRVAASGINSDNPDEEPKPDRNPPRTMTAAKTGKASAKLIAPEAPAHFPRPRPEFEDLADVLNEVDLAAVDADALGVGAEAFDPFGELGSALPDENTDEDELGGESGVQRPGQIDSGLDPNGNSLGSFDSELALLGLLENTNSPEPANSNAGGTADAASSFWGVTEDKIAAAIGGVAGEKTGSRDTRARWQSGAVYNEDDGLVYVAEGRQRTSNGNMILVETGVSTGAVNEEGRVIQATRRVRETDSDGRLVYESYYERSLDPETGQVYVESSSTGRSGTGTSESILTDSGVETPNVPVDQLRDPDSGYGGPSPFPWLNEEPKSMFEIVSAGTGPGGLPEAPHHASPDINNYEEPIVSQHDLLATYDPDTKGDNDNRGMQMTGTCVPACE